MCLRVRARRLHRRGAFASLVKPCAACYRRRMNPLSDNMKGAALMSASMACFTVNDALMKALGQTVPFFQALFRTPAFLGQTLL